MMESSEKGPKKTGRRKEDAGIYGGSVLEQEITICGTRNHNSKFNKQSTLINIKCGWHYHTTLGATKKLVHTIH